jgi:hypothetical protein
MVSIAKRRTKLRRGRDVVKMPEEMLRWPKRLKKPKIIKEVSLMTDLGLWMPFAEKCNNKLTKKGNPFMGCPFLDIKGARCYLL